jgi:hypothetical protein
MERVEALVDAAVAGFRRRLADAVTSMRRADSPASFCVQLSER